MKQVLSEQAAFDRCVDFLVRMIEKYGNDIFAAETISDNTDTDEKINDLITTPAA